MKVFGVPVVFYLLVLSIISCQVKERDTKETTSVELKFLSNPVKLSDLINDIELIKLETNESSRIGYVTSVKYFDSKYFILDAYVAKSLFVFDSTGNFLYKIDGATETGLTFEFPINFQISSLDSLIWILDPNMYLIAKYNVDGSFVEIKDLNEPPIDFAFSKEGDVIMDYGGLTYYESPLILTNRSLSRVEPIIDIKQRKRSLNQSLSNHEGHVTYIPSLRNSVFSVREDSSVKLFDFYFDVSWLNESQIRKYMSQDYSEMWSDFSRSYPYKYFHYENSDFILLPFLYQNEENKALFFVSKEDLAVINAARIVNDLGKLDIKTVRGAYENYFISVQSSEELSMNKGQIISTYDSVLSQVKEGHNPVLVKYTVSN